MQAFPHVPPLGHAPYSESYSQPPPPAATYDARSQAQHAQPPPIHRQYQRVGPYGDAIGAGLPNPSYPPNQGHVPEGYCSAYASMGYNGTTHPTGGTGYAANHGPFPGAQYPPVGAASHAAGGGRAFSPAGYPAYVGGGSGTQDAQYGVRDDAHRSTTHHAKQFPYDFNAASPFAPGSAPAPVDPSGRGYRHLHPVASGMAPQGAAPSTSPGVAPPTAGGSGAMHGVQQTNVHRPAPQGAVPPGLAPATTHAPGGAYDHPRQTAVPVVGVAVPQATSFNQNTSAAAAAPEAMHGNVSGGGNPPNTAPVYSGPFVGKLQPPDGVVPIDLGPDVTYADALAIWYNLTEDDQHRLIEMYRRAQRGQPMDPAALDSLSIDPLFTPGSAPAAQPRQRAPRGKAKKAAAPPELAVPETSSAAPKQTYKQPYVEDANESSEEEPLANKAKGKGKARAHNGSTMPRATNSAAGPNAGLSPTPGAAQQGGTHFGVVMLDAVQGLDERIGRMENWLYSHLQGHKSARKSKSKQSRDVNIGGAEEEASDMDVDDIENEAESSDASLEDEATDAEEVRKREAEKKRRDHPHQVRLAAAVRHHLDKTLLKLKHVSYLPLKFPTLTKAQLAEYDRYTTAYFTRENFGIDFVRSWKKCSYNVEAREFFIDDFLDAVNGGSYSDPPIPRHKLTRHCIGETLDSHIKHLRSEYTRFANPDPVKERKRKLRKRCASRQKTTLKVRKLVVDLHELQRHKILFEKLRPSHMSGDEPEFDSEDGERQNYPRRFFIVEAEWQSKLLKDFLRTLDQWHIEDWRQSIGDRLPGGSPPRIRVVRLNPKVRRSAPPKGLWRNCYDQKWLKKLKPHKRRELEIIDKDYNFSLPEWTMPEDLMDNSDILQEVYDNETDDE